MISFYISASKRTKSVLARLENSDLFEILKILGSEIAGFVKLII
jgi:hypothetical protein